MTIIETRPLPEVIETEAPIVVVPPRAVPNPSAVDFLEAALVQLQFRGWVKHTHHDFMGRVCAIGALDFGASALTGIPMPEYAPIHAPVWRGFDGFAGAWNALAAAMGVSTIDGGIAHWNDGRLRRKAQVVAAYRRAIKIAGRG